MSAWKFYNCVDAELLIYVERFVQKNFKGIEENLQPSQSSSSSSNYLFLVQQKNKLYNKVTRK